MLLTLPRPALLLATVKCWVLYRRQDKRLSCQAHNLGGLGSTPKSATRMYPDEPQKSGGGRVRIAYASSAGEVKPSKWPCSPVGRTSDC